VLDAEICVFTEGCESMKLFPGDRVRAIFRAIVSVAQRETSSPMKIITRKRGSCKGDL
jgi:hypothetical protein